MADLAALNEAMLAVDDSTADSAVVQAYLDQAEALFESACGRSHRPFADVLTGRVESHPGTGRSDLYLDYPVGTLTSVVLGLDTTDPDETLVVSGTGKNVYVDTRQPVRLYRTDGGTFGEPDTPLTVHVTYTSVADLPEDATAAVLRATRLLYESTAIGVASERLGGYSVESVGGSVDALEQDPVWSLAVSAHREIHL